MEGQLLLLEKFSFNDELLNIPVQQSDNDEFYYNNGGYESGDAEYLYNIIRFFKPEKIIEIGG